MSLMNLMALEKFVLLHNLIHKFTNDIPAYELFTSYSRYILEDKIIPAEYVFFITSVLTKQL